MRRESTGLGVRRLPADHSTAHGLAPGRHLHRQLGVYLEHVHLAAGRRNSEDMFTMELGLMYFQRQFITLYGGSWPPAW